MLALTILIAVVLIMVVVLLVASQLFKLLLPLVVIMVPLVILIGSGLIGLIEMLLFFGGPDDRRFAKKELSYLSITFFVSLALFWISAHFLLHI